MANACVITATTNISSVNDVHVFNIKDAYTGRFIKNSEYKLRFDAIGTRSSNSGNLNPKLLFYVHVFHFGHVTFRDLYYQKSFFLQFYPF